MKKCIETSLTIESTNKIRTALKDRQAEAGIHRLWLRFVFALLPYRGTTARRYIKKNYKE